MKCLRKWSDEKRAREARAEAIVSLRALGYSWQQIARAMNTTRGVVQGSWYKTMRKRMDAEGRRGKGEEEKSGTEWIGTAEEYYHYVQDCRNGHAKAWKGTK